MAHPNGMGAFHQTTVIVWDGAAQQLVQWLYEQHGESSAASPLGQATLDTRHAIEAEPFPWDSSKAESCLENVQSLVAALSGEAVFGWALADCGPISVSASGISPLYCRWINHVVWRDGNGKLWEVTPRFSVSNRGQVAWLATQFLADNDASFSFIENGLHSTQPSRYVALRPEGAQVAEYLNRAERSANDQLAINYVRMAFAAIVPHGFTPKECHIEMIDSQIHNLWMYAT